MDKRTALITGASSGIGASLAQFLADKGIHVVLIARRKEKLRELSKAIRKNGGACDIFPADLSVEKERKVLFEEITSRFGKIDVLVNNAGFGWYGYFRDMPWTVARQIIDVNVSSAVHLTALFLPRFLEQGSGQVINVSSIAGGLPNQGIAMYAGSKAFLDAFSTALYREYHQQGVYVSALRLGAVRTEFYDRARKQPHGRSIPAERLAISTERVNLAVWRLLERPRRVVYIPVWLSITKFVEPLFGPLIDLLGPLLLKHRQN